MDNNPVNIVLIVVVAYLALGAYYWRYIMSQPRVRKELYESPQKVQRITIIISALLIPAWLIFVCVDTFRILRRKYWHWRIGRKIRKMYKEYSDVSR